MIFVYPGPAQDGPPFFAKHWPGALAIADPEGTLAAAFGVPRGRFRQLFGFRAIGAALRALARGYGIGKPSGDVLRMPGIVVIDGTAVAREIPFEHIGERPDLKALAVSG